MEDSVLSQTYVFKLHCPKCQKKMQKLLSALQGDYSIKVDAGRGKVTVKSTVHPNTLVQIFGEMMKGAKSSCESLPPPPPPLPPNNHNLPVDQQWSHVPMAISGGNVHPNMPQHYFKGFRAGDLQELGKIPRLKQLDVTHSRNLKMTFNDDLENNGPKAESNKGAGQDPGPSNMGGCPPQLNGAPGECSEIRNLPHSMDFVVSYGGSSNAPSPTEFHSQPTPPPYQGHPQAAPPPAVPHDISLSCDDMSKCTVM